MSDAVREMCEAIVNHTTLCPTDASVLEERDRLARVLLAALPLVDRLRTVHPGTAHNLCDVCRLIRAFDAIVKEEEPKP